MSLLNSLRNLARRVSTGLPYDGPRTLILVESPTKADTLRAMLRKELPGVTILATLGHLRDLPADRLAVDTAAGFKPEYEVDMRHGQTVAALQKALPESGS